MKKIGIAILNLFIFFFLAQTAFAMEEVKLLVPRVVVPAKFSVSRTQWTTVISICNPTANPVPLTDIELHFNYSVKMPTGIWGKPWAEWRRTSQVGQEVMLEGGTQWTPALQPDPKCLSPMTVIFNSTSSQPLPQGPFVFKAAGYVPPNAGDLSVRVPAAPEAGLSNPKITVKGAGHTFEQTVAWGMSWQLAKLPAGTYTVTSGNVANATRTYQANPVTVNVTANTTVQANMVYTQVVPTTGSMTITVPAAPEAGLNNPQITVQGAGQTFNQTVAWGAQWKLPTLSAGAYVVSSSTVTTGARTYQADPVNVTVTAGSTAQATFQYRVVTPDTGNVTITLPAAPEAGVANPQLTLQGMGKTFNQTVAWGTQWKLTSLDVGTYKVTSTVVGNGVRNYQATPVNVTVSVNATAQVTVPFELVSGGTGNITITLPATPEAGLSNPQITVQGMGTSVNKAVTWGTQWQLTNLATGSYTVTSSNVSNGTHTYQAAPVTVTVTANTTAPVSLSYTEGRPVSWKDIKHVVIIIFENMSAANTLKQPYFKALTTKGAYLTSSFARTHPSQPNYIALTAGSTLGVTDNDNHNLNAKHIGDLFDAKGLTWKTYAEAYPGNCFQGGSYNGLYARKHEPFISYTSVQSNPTQCAKVLSGTQFFTDLNANRLPTYSFYVPDIDNSGHDTGVAFADRWLSNTFGAIFNNAEIMKSTLFIITFDEDDGSANNNIYTAFVGAGVKPGATSSKNYNHYSLLRTIEDIFQLGSLGTNDQSANEIMDIWLP